MTATTRMGAAPGDAGGQHGGAWGGLCSLTARAAGPPAGSGRRRGPRHGAQGRRWGLPSVLAGSAAPAELLRGARGAQGTSRGISPQPGQGHCARTALGPSPPCLGPTATSSGPCARAGGQGGGRGARGRGGRVVPARLCRHVGTKPPGGIEAPLGGLGSRCSRVLRPTAPPAPSPPVLSQAHLDGAPLELSGSPQPLATRHSTQAPPRRQEALSTAAGLAQGRRPCDNKPGRVTRGT